MTVDVIRRVLLAEGSDRKPINREIPIAKSLLNYFQAFCFKVTYYNNVRIQNVCCQNRITYVQHTRTLEYIIAVVLDR